MEINQKKEFWIILYLSCFGMGKIKYAPGTFGSLFALLILLINEDLLTWIIIPLVLINFFVSYKLIDKLNGKFGKDPKWIVQDEVIGMWIALSSPIIPHNFAWVLLAFILFRFFDILKPYPINLLDQKTGSLYIILDDVVAGIFSVVLLHFIFWIYEIFPFLVIFYKNI